MDIFELAKLKTGLATAFPDFFRIEDEGVTTGAFKAKRGEWVILHALTGNPVATFFDALLGACLDAATSRGWGLDINKFPRYNTLVSIAQELNNDDIAEWQEIAQGTHETPAIAAALAILEAHRVTGGEA